MPEPYIINGTITASDGIDRARLRVQAFDRDLPSLERRMDAETQMLGEAVTDAEGRFQIIYTLEQFRTGEGIPLFRTATEQNADLSFRVFDRTGQELSIRSIEGLNRGFGPNEIIFNAPAQLEVRIFVVSPPEGSSSEYEQLVAQIAPVIEDVPLAELTDEDVAFLINELGAEQQPEVQQRMEWLRDSALIAQQTDLPVEAFYGWARTSLPDLWSELHPLGNADRRANVIARLTDQLAATEEEALVAHLTRAIEERTIPSRLRDRVGAIARAIRRRGQEEHSVRLRLEREPTGEVLGGYTVTTLDADAGNRDLGTDVTDALGEFTVTYYGNADAGHAERNLRFRVRGPAVVEAVEVTEGVRPDAAAPVGVRVSLPSGQPTLQQLRGDGHIDVPDAVLQTLEQTHAIRTFADIRRRGGLNSIADLAGVDAAVVHRLDALAYLDLLSGDLNETSALLTHRFDSVIAIAEVPRSEFVATMSAEGAGLSEGRATELHVAAKAQIDTLGQIYVGLAADSANGFKPPSR